MPVEKGAKDLAHKVSHAYEVVYAFLAPYIQSAYEYMVEMAEDAVELAEYAYNESMAPVVTRISTHFSKGQNPEYSKVPQSDGFVEVELEVDSEDEADFENETFEPSNTL